MITNRDNVERYGNVSSSPYSIPFPFWEENEIVVWVSNAEEDVRLDPSQYSFTSDRKVQLTAETVSEYGTYKYLTIQRIVDATQPTAYDNGTNIDAEAIERNLDRLTAMVQQLEEAQTRSIKTSVAEVGSDISLPDIEGRKDGLLAFSPDGKSMTTRDIRQFDRDVSDTAANATAAAGSASQAASYRDQAEAQKTEATSQASRAKDEADRAESIVNQAETDIDTYVEGTAKPSIATYVENTTKPSIVSYVENTTKPSVDSYVENTTKPNINSYVENTTKPSIAVYSESKVAEDVESSKGEISTYVENTSKPSIDSYVDTSVKPGITTFAQTTSRAVVEAYVESTAKSELDAYTVTKEGEITTYTEGKKAELDTYVNNTSKPSIATYVDGTSKPAIDSYFNSKKAEWQGQLDGITTTLNTKADKSAVMTSTEILNMVYPVGSIYLTISTGTTGSGSPASFLGGTWTRIDADKALWTASSGAGTAVDGALPKITGTVNAGYAIGAQESTSTATGSFRWGSSKSYCWKYNSANATYFTTLNFDAANMSGSVYTNTTNLVRPTAYKVYAWRRTA